jgi:uncharacterized integral membrane protein
MNDQQQQPAPVATGRSGPRVTLIAGGILVLLVAWFFARNSKDASLDFLFFTKTTTVRWLIGVSVLLGVAVDRAFSIWWHHRAKQKKQ